MQILLEIYVHTLKREIREAASKRCVDCAIKPCHRGAMKETLSFKVHGANGIMHLMNILTVPFVPFKDQPSNISVCAGARRYNTDKLKID